MADFQRLQQAVFLSTLSLRRATWRVFFPLFSQFGISIHALLAESDAQSFKIIVFPS